MIIPEAKQRVFRDLLESIVDRYGPNAFPLAKQQPEAEEHVVLTSAHNTRFAASIIAAPNRPGYFSVMFEIYGSPNAPQFPFEITEDGVFKLGEVVELLGKYRE